MTKGVVFCALRARVRIGFVLLAIATVSLVPTTVAVAQTSGAATLVGTISDGSAALVPGAKVTVINVSTSFRSETQSSTEGTYYVPYLSPGTYRITVEAGGFRTLVRDGVVLRTGETPRVDIVLEVGSLTESVNVSAAAPLLSTDTAEAGTILGSEQLVAIPIPFKKLQRLSYYYQGVLSSSGIHMMGQRQRAMAVTMDGLGSKQPVTGAALSVDESPVTTMDAVQEAKMSTTGVSAETGHAGGGAMNLVFRSGTNRLHGTFDERFLTQDMIHRHYLQEFPSSNPYHYSEFETTGGGPLYFPKLYNGKDRTFWLLGLALHREMAGNPSQPRSVPSDAMYNGDFSFGGQGLPIYNPFTTRQDAAGNWLRDPFSGNQISPSLFDPVVKNFLAKNPFNKATSAGTMTNTGPVENLKMDESKQIHRTRWDIKIDHQFTSNHKIFGRYSQAHHRAARGSSPHYSEFAWDLLDYGAQPTPTDLVNIVVNDTLVLGPSRYNEVRLGYNRRAYTLDPLSYGQGWAQTLGIPNVSGETFPFFNIGYRSTSMGRERQVGEDVMFQNNFTQILGPHTLKAGYELTRTRYNAVMAALPSGSYNFSGTELPFTPNTGNTFASFLLGTVGSAVYTQDFASWLPRFWQHAWYVQDDWKPVRGLMLGLGLRWAYETPFQTKYGQQSQFNPTMIDPLTGKMGAVTHPVGQLASKDLNNFQPRLGLVWNFRPKFVFRSSFAISKVDLQTNGICQNFQEYQGTVNIQSPPGDPRHVFLLSQGPPPFRYTQNSNGSSPFVGTNYSARNVDWYDPNIRMPYIMSWSGGFQYQFTNNWLAELLYQGAAGVRLLNAWNVNAIRLDVSKDPAVLNQIYQATQNYKPYPQFGNINFYSNFGHNTHHAGTVRLEKRYSTGMTLVGFYTFQKTLDEADNDGVASGISYYNRRLEKARAGYDARHHFTSILTYELPLGKGRRLVNRGGVLNHLLGGWDITWTQSFESGLPASVTFSGGPYKYLPGSSRPNALVPMEQAVVQGWSIGPHRFPSSAQNPYLNFSAFAYPAAFTAGTLGRNTFEIPGTNWTQLSAAKIWTVGERLRFTTRVDLGNLPFPQPQFAAPNSTYSTNSPLTFGRFSGVRGDYTSFGQGQPNIEIGLRAEF